MLQKEITNKEEYEIAHKRAKELMDAKSDTDAVCKTEDGFGKLTAIHYPSLEAVSV